MAEEAPIRKVGVIAHGGREEALAAARSLIDWLHERGVATRSLAGERVGAREEVEESRFGEGLDLVLSVGGDGTLLRVGAREEVEESRFGEGLDLVLSVG